jgi:hypothetical protein
MSVSLHIHREFCNFSMEGETPFLQDIGKANSQSCRCFGSSGNPRRDKILASNAASVIDGLIDCHYFQCVFLTIEKVWILRLFRFTACSFAFLLVCVTFLLRPFSSSTKLLHENRRVS